jgi:hypothetical protein
MTGTVTVKMGSSVLLWKVLLPVPVQKVSIPCSVNLNVILQSVSGRNRKGDIRVGMSCTADVPRSFSAILCDTATFASWPPISGQYCPSSKMLPEPKATTWVAQPYFFNSVAVMPTCIDRWLERSNDHLHRCECILTTYM